MLLMMLPLLARAERVVLERVQETVPGQSVFVTAPHPLLGNAGVVTSVRLHPGRYPVWELPLELPPGTSLVPTFYLRSDAPADIASASNGTVLGQGAPVQVPVGRALGPEHRVFTGAGIERVFATVSGAEPVEFTPEPYEQGILLWRGRMRPADVAMARQVRVSIDGFLLPRDTPVRLTWRDTWWRHEHLFHYEPGAQAPAAPRRESFAFQPTGFRSRTITVVLPRGYDQSAPRAYPVLYAQDGQNVLVPGGAFGTWSLDPTVEALTRRGEIPEIIIVAIDNTPDRFAEYTPEYGSVGGVQGRGGEFLSRLRDELLPEIARRYRVLEGPDHTAHLGSSLGGLLGYLAANEFQDTWGAVGAVSPSFQVSTAENLRRARLGPEAWGRLWIDSGSPSDNYANCAAVRDAFIGAGSALGPQFFHMVDPGKGHNEAAWAGRTPEILRWIYQSEPALDSSGVSGVIVH